MSFSFVNPFRLRWNGTRHYNHTFQTKVRWSRTSIDKKCFNLDYSKGGTVNLFVNNACNEIPDCKN